MQANKLLKFNIGVWLKNKGEYFIWEIVVILSLIAMLAGANIYALNKFDEASEVLNTTSEIMLTKTGIVIDSVNIELFQKAELIIAYKQKLLKLPQPLRNIFLFNAFLGDNGNKTGVDEKL